jgi:hypothetical protein
MTAVTIPLNKNTDIPPPPSNILSPYINTALIKLHPKLINGVNNRYISQYLNMPI